MDQILNHKFIVFCGDHYNPLGLIRSLGEMGVKPYVIMVDKHPVMINHCRYVKHIHITRSIEEGYGILRSEYGNEKNKPFLYTCDDGITSFLDLNYNELKDAFYFFHGKEEGIISYYMDKENICKLAVECGCKIAKTEMVPVGVIPKNLKYPVITKAINSLKGGWKNDSFICQVESDLIEAYKHIKSERVLVQEYVDKKNELCLDGFCFNNGEDVYIPYYSNYLRFSNKSYGPYMVMRPFLDEKLMGQVKLMLKKVGFTGIFSVEFLVDKNDNLFFLEVNFRNSTWSYAYTCGGYNMPYLWAIATIVGKLDLSDIKPQNEFTAMVEPTDFLDNVLHGKKVGLKQWISERQRCKCLYYYNSNDKAPYYYYWWSYMKRTAVNRLLSIFHKVRLR